MSSSVNIMKEFSRLKHTGSTLNPAVLQTIPKIDIEDHKFLLRPYMLWSTSLDQQEYDSAAVLFICQQLDGECQIFFGLRRAAPSGTTS